LGVPAQDTKTSETALYRTQNIVDKEYLLISHVSAKRCPSYTLGEFLTRRGKTGYVEPVPKLIDCALTRTVLGQVFAVFQVFNLAKLRILRLLSQN
jgi:hypothetical protein